MSNIKYLHIIRGFAAFFVLLAHAKWPFWIGGSAYLAQQSFWQLSIVDKAGVALALCSSNGATMVIMFYVLSGFIISHSYKKNGWTYKQFLVNRSLRIYIPYIASALLAGMVLFSSYHLARGIFNVPIKDYHQRVMVAYTEGLSLTNFLQTLFFIKSERVNYFGFNYVYWSLLYEMIFYLFFPLLLKYFKYLLWASAFVIPVHIFYHPLPEINDWYLYLTQYLLYFLLGVGLYRLFDAGVFERFKSSWWMSKKILTAAIVALFFLSQGLGLTSFKTFGFLAATLMAVFWIIYLMIYGIRHLRVMKPFLFLGSISYSLYLVHVPLLLFFYSLCFYFFQASIYTSPFYYLLFAFLVLPLAYVFYLLFEKFSFKLITKQKLKLTQRKKDVVDDQPLKLV